MVPIDLTPDDDDDPVELPPAKRQRLGPNVPPIQPRMLAKASPPSLPMPELSQTALPSQPQPQSLTAGPLLNELQTRIRIAAQNRDYQELQKSQSEIDRILEAQRPPFFELKRALESGSLSRNPAFENLKDHYDQKQKFITILESFKNAVGSEMQRIVQAAGRYASLPAIVAFPQKTNSICLQGQCTRCCASAQLLCPAPSA